MLAPALLSVVIPAHDEAAVIGRLLSGLQPYAERGEMRVVVACNGCTDDTSDVARQAAPAAMVVEVAPPSKTAALNLGDDLCGGVFPRFYVDADIQLSGDALLTLRRRLEGGLLAVAPSVRYDASRSSQWVRRHLKIFELLTPHAGGIHGTGVMGVSAEGRQRFDRWPEVVADDYFLDGLYTSCEKSRIDEVEVVVTVSRRVPDLVRRRSRVRRANAEVHRRGLRSSTPRAGSLPVLLRSRPELALDAAVFVGIVLLTRVYERWSSFRGHSGFTRDDSR